jgi:hypothetical protein
MRKIAFLFVGLLAPASLIPIRITQAMLDTIDGKLLDLRYQYVLVSPGR